MDFHDFFWAGDLPHTRSQSFALGEIKAAKEITPASRKMLTISVAKVFGPTLDAETQVMAKAMPDVVAIKDKGAAVHGMKALLQCMGQGRFPRTEQACKTRDSQLGAHSTAPSVREAQWPGARYRYYPILGMHTSGNGDQRSKVESGMFNGGIKEFG